MSRACGRASLVAVLLLAACFCFTELAEVDFHWHLLSGQRMLSGQGIPRVDDLTYSSAGRPWIDLQWLFEILVAATDRLFHATGLDLLKVGLIVGGFGMAMRAALRRGAPVVVAGVGLLGVLASQERFALRPESVSFLLLGTLLDLLETRRNRPGRLFVIPGLMAVWANLHALYAVGLATIMLTLAGDLIETLLPGMYEGHGDPAPGPGRLGAIMALSIPATLLTPYGFATWALPLRLLFERVAGANLTARSIAEFQPPLGGFGPTTAIFAFVILAFLIVIAGVAAPRRQRPADVALLGAFLGLALLARRNMPLFALSAIPAGSAVLTASARALGLDGATQEVGAIWRPRLEAAAAGAVCALVVLIGVDVVGNRFYARDGSQRYFGRGPAPAFYPETAAGILQERGLQGEVLNDMTSGGYLAWRWYPERRVFIDGRLEVQAPDLFAAYVRLQSDPVFFEDLARRHGVEAVLWSHHDGSAAAPLLRYLAGGHGWHLAFVDLAAALFVRDGARTRSGEPWGSVESDDPGVLAGLRRQLQEARAASKRADPLPVALRRLLPRLEVPVAAANAAIFFAVTGAPVSAEALFREALSVSPRDATLHYDLGMVLERLGRPAEARRALDEALSLDPRFAPARSALGLLSLKAGEADEALEQWRLAERTATLGPSVLEARGALLASRGRLDEAIVDYRSLLRVEPARNDIRLALARLQTATGDLVGSERSFRQLLRDDPASVEAHLGMAVVLASTGRAEAAIDECAQALRHGLDPARLGSVAGLRALDGNPAFQRLLGPTNGS